MSRVLSADLPVTVYTPQADIRRPGRMLRRMVADLRASRALAWRLALRDIRAQYRQSLLGYLWAFITPLATTVVWVFLNSSGVVKVADTGIPYTAYVFAGTMLWQVFVQALQSPIQETSAARGMLVKLNFPREGILLAGILKQLSSAGIKLVILLPAILLLGVRPDWHLLLFPLGLLSLLMAGFAIGLIVSPLGMLDTDVGKAIPLVGQFAMYITRWSSPCPLKARWSPSSSSTSSPRSSSPHAPGSPAWPAPCPATTWPSPCAPWPCCCWAGSCTASPCPCSSSACPTDPMANEVLIRAEGVGKKFCRDLKTSLKYGVMDLTAEVFGGARTSELRPKEFWAVQGVDFELRRGESLALIGHNGAGKTTLLQILNGLIKPDRGRIEMRGTVGAMIALGAGFNPVLTGRENIYVNAAVLGLGRRVVDERIDEVIAFSEIGEFIDSPVRNYSSGMSVRLGFSVAALLLKPDILLLDEVLAVGDLPFRIKCLNHMRSIMADCAVIFVSHSMPTVSSFCNRAILMDHGRVKSLPDDDMGTVIQRYVDLAPVRRTSPDDPDARIMRFLHQGAPVDGPLPVRHGERLQLEAEMELDGESEVSLLVLAEGTLPLVQYRLGNDSTEGRPFAAGQHKVLIDLGVIDLSPARYTVDVIIRNVRTKISKRLYQVCYLQVEHHLHSWHHMLRAAPFTEMEAVVLHRQ